MSDWRLRAAGEAFASYAAVADLEGRALVLGDPDPGAARALEGRGLEAVRWSRRAGGDPVTVVSAWPPAGPFRTAALRLPKAKGELEMTLHGAVAALEPGGVVLVYGANDEGARSADARIEPLLGDVAAVMKKRRCRVLRVERPEAVPGLRPRLDEWRLGFPLTLGGVERPWVSYPGVFAHGRLDPGTALLLEHLPELPDESRVLDFGCGSGVVAAAVLERDPSARLDLLDNDAVALAAARENVSADASFVLGDSLDAVGGPYHAIVGNPPYHAGKAETTDVLEELIRGAPGKLAPGGTLTIVVQRRLPVERVLRRAFGEVRRIAEEGPYAVWRATAGG